MLTWAIVFFMIKTGTYNGMCLLISVVGDVAIAGLIANAACGGCMGSGR